jgi:hypothetical protein
MLPILLLAVLVAPSAIPAQSTARLTVRYDSADGVRDCSVSVGDTVPSGIHTNSVLVRFARVRPEKPDSAVAAPFAVRVAVGSRDAVSIAKGADTVRLNLVHTALRGSVIRVSKPGESGFLCNEAIEEEGDPREIDPAFQILAGVEFISLDGFRERTAHIPAMARWIIPIYVWPAGEQDERGSWMGRKRRHWHRNPYSLLTTSAEYTRVAGEARNFICAGTTIPDTVNPGAVDGAECSPNHAKGSDSVTVFREQAGETLFQTHGVWRITSSYRHEGNVRWVDNDVYAGPVLTLGVQTDPGIGGPDFFSFFTAGLSLTQVEITPEYFIERFNLQVSWGRSPNFSERVLLLPDSTEVREEIKVPYTNRAYVTAAFQPIAGYYLRGSAEFGRGIPDVARVGVHVQLNVERLIGSVFGPKEQPASTDPTGGG